MGNRSSNPDEQERSPSRDDWTDVARIISAAGDSPLHTEGSRFADLLARAIVTAEPGPGHFVDVLDHLIAARIAAALEDGDHHAVTTLVEFGKVRSKGIRLSHKFGQTFTRVTPEGPLAGLFEKIDRDLFASPRLRDRIVSTDRAEQEFRQEYELEERSRGARRPVWCYRITRSASPDTITIHHARNEEIPLLLGHLGRLWDFFFEAECPETRLEKIAEIEWWFMASNIPGRCSAALGDALSIVLRRSAGLALRKGFVHLDWEVLSRPLDEFLKWRAEISPDARI